MKMMESISRWLVLIGLVSLILMQPVRAATWYVSAWSGNDGAAGTNWATAKQTIQVAIDASSAGDTVLVSNGVYYTGGRSVYSNMTNRIALTKPITVRSVNGRLNTSIWGSYTDVFHRVRCAYVTNGAVLDGFRLTAGYSKADGDMDRERSGGGVWCETNGVVSNCLIEVNWASWYGGGAYGGTLSHCTVSDNSAQTGAGTAYCVVKNSTITRNATRTYGDGGGTYQGTLNECVISRNSAGYNGGGSMGGTLSNCVLELNTTMNFGGGVLGGTLSFCTLSENAAGTNGGGACYSTLNSCVLISNRAQYGGGAYTGVLNNCLLTGNFATNYGGGSCGSTLVNCTLTANTADFGGGSYLGPANNCIMYYNSAWSGPDRSGGEATNCCIGSGYGGSGNFTNEPLIVSLANPHLLTGSPCIDAGNNNFATGLDIDGQTRIAGGVVDVGCDEFTTPVTGALGVVTIIAAWTNFATGCPAAFEAVVTGMPRSLVWNWSDGSSTTNMVRTTHIYATTGVFTVTLTATNDSWSSSTSITVQVVSPPVSYVAPGGNHVAPFTNWVTAATNIQAAIDVIAIPGAIVLVSNGIYASGGTVVYGAMTNRVAITVPAIVQSVNGPAYTAIVGSGPAGNSAVRCVYLTNGAVLAGFTLTNGTIRTGGDSDREQCGGGVWCESGAVVSNCTISGNYAADSGGGVWNGVLFNCTLSSNRAQFYGGGARYSMLNSCTVSSNSASWGGGAYGGTLNSCVLDGNSASMGGGAEGGTLYSCVLINNKSAGEGGGAYSCTLNNCTLSKNSASTGGGGSYYCNLYNCIISYNSGAYSPNILLGKADHCCTTPQPDNGTGHITNEPLFVATNNYHLSASSPCIDAGDNSYVSGTQMDIDGNPRVVHGNVDMGAHEFVQYPIHYVAPGGGSVFPFATWEEAATNIQDAVDAATNSEVVIVSNGVYASGGRVVFGSMTNRVAITKPITVRSLNGAAVTTIKGAWNPTGTNGDAAVRCVFMTNGAVLSGFTLTNGATRASGDTTLEQSGGGLWCWTGVVISNCILAGNSAAQYGGGSYAGKLNNCILAGNTAYRGGGAAYATLNNGTLCGNFANYGGGTYVSGLTNCISYYNSSPSGANWNGGTNVYCCTTPSSGGTGNITNAPVFMATNDFHLTPGSPGIDAGNNAYALGPADLDGKLRIVNGVVDMGAYEYRGTNSPNLFWYVATNGNDFAAGTNWTTAKQTIQAAIDQTINGDTVIVSNGVYATGGRVVDGAMTNRIVIPRAITVRSLNGASMTTIAGAWNPVTTNGDAAVRCVYITNNAVICGFTLTNGATRTTGSLSSEESGGGILCMPGAVVSNCILAGNSAAGFGGGSYAGTLNNCLLVGNTASWGGGAAYATLNNATLSGNGASSGGGTYVSALTNSIMFYNRAQNGPNWNGGTNVYCCSTPSSGGLGCITNEPLYSATNDFHLIAGSPCINAGNNAYAPGATDLDGNVRIINGTVDIGAYERRGPGSPNIIWYVATNGSDSAAGTNWPTAKLTIQAALDQTIDGDSVLVSNGVYAAGGRVVYGAMTNRIAIINAVAVNGVNGPAVTIIKGAADPASTNGDAAVRCAYVGTNAFLSGFTLTNGHTRSVGDDYLERSGGGVLCATNSNAVVSNCTISGNSASYSGGGSVFGTLNNCVLSGNSEGYWGGGGSEQGVLNNCTLSGNAAQTYGGGADLCTLNNCTLSSNTSQRGGGAFSCVLNNCVLSWNVATNAGGGSVGGTLNGCTLSRNSTTNLGGGSFGGVLNSCTLSGNSASNYGGGAYGSTLSNCTLSGNSAIFGGGVCVGKLNNCIVTGNSAEQGGGSYVSVMNNCVIYGNSAIYGGGVDFGTNSNCILYFNSAPNGANYNAFATLRYCCTTPNPGGIGNIAADPQFVDPANSNFHLLASSPCIDRGSNAYAPGVTDLDGNPRIMFGAVDMGAYELQSPVGYWLWTAAITNGQTNYNQCAAGDGYPNLLKYATGSNPTNSDQLPRLRCAWTNGVAALLFNRNTNAVDVTLIVEGSNAATNNVAWSGVATNSIGSWGGATNVVESGAGSPVVVAIPDTATAATNRFLRLRVTRP